MSDISIVAVIAGAVAFFLLGALWYTFLFRAPWAHDMGFADDLPEAPQSPPVQALVGSFVIALVLAYVMTWFIGGAGFRCGLEVGTRVGAVVAAVMGQNALYDSRPARLWLINAGYAFIGTVLVGIIVGVVG